LKIKRDLTHRLEKADKTSSVDIKTRAVEELLQTKLKY